MNNTAHDGPAAAQKSECRVGLSAYDSKRLATLTARAALAGVVVHAIESDFGGAEFIVSKWALTKSLCSLDALEVWLDRVAGKSPGRPE